MTRQSSYSRRQFFRVGAAGVAATVVTAPRRGRGVAHAAVQGPPPLNTAPRVLRKPPLDELGRIAKSYDLDLSTEDLASFRTLPAPGSVRGADAARQVCSQRGLPPARVREPAQRVVLEVLDQGRALGTTGG